MKVSCCWIVKNEEKNIARSIESVKDGVDEMVIVDTGSDDGTVEIARSLGARVLHFEWIGDFAAARNHGMDAAIGDVLVVLDADEWFEPKLRAADREKIISRFKGNPKLGSLTIPITNVKTDGAKIGSSVVQRIFRNKSDIRYRGRIHEQATTDGYSNLLTEDFPLKHTGYSTEIINDKLERNANLLVDELAHETPGSDDHVKMLFYIVREKSGLGDYDTAAEHLRELLKYPSAAKRVCTSCNIEFISTIYAALQVALAKREQISRRAVHQRLVKLIKDMYPSYAGTAEIDLVYTACFDLKEDKLLGRLEAAFAAANKMEASSTHYKSLERILFHKAALAAWRRSDHIRMLDYAVNAMSEKMSFTHPTLAIMLGAIKGQPPQDVIMFLNGLCDITDTATLEFIIKNTRMEGLATVHSYYLKKHADNPQTDDSALLSLMLLHKKYDELIGVVLQTYAQLGTEEGEQAAKIRANLSRYAFLAAICGASPALVAQCEQLLGGYMGIINAYNLGRRLEQVTQQEELLMHDTYEIVAFAIGPQAAERYLEIFRARPAPCYRAKARYCEVSGLDEYLLGDSMEGIHPLDFSCHTYRIQAMMFAGLYDDALREIARFFEAQIIEQGALYMLLVIAEKAPEPTASAARKLYSRYFELFDLVLDLQDVANTGFVFDDGGAKMKKALKAMTRAQLDKYLEEESDRPVITGLPAVLRAAAGVYAQQDVLTEAARCLIRLMAIKQDTADDREKLAEIFTSLGNKTLPGLLREQ